LKLLEYENPGSKSTHVNKKKNKTMILIVPPIHFKNLDSIFAILVSISLQEKLRRFRLKTGNHSEHENICTSTKTE